MKQYRAKTNKQTKRLRALAGIVAALVLAAVAAAPAVADRGAFNN